MTKAWFWSLAAASLLAACVSDGDPRDNHEPIRALLSGDAMMFAGFDSDGDLRVSQPELEAGITREFARADTSHDGSISPIEFGAWSTAALGGQQTAPYRLDFDRNVDNTITRDEFHNEVTSRAHDYDVNEDNLLDRSEFIREVGRTAAPRGGPEGGQGRRMERREGPPRTQ